MIRSQAVGVVLLGMGEPVVLCAVDWCGLRNDAHLAWRQALAGGRPHDAGERGRPVRPSAQRPVRRRRGREADRRRQRPAVARPEVLRPGGGRRRPRPSRQSLAKTAPFTHVGIGQAKVEQVASNRRILGADGKVKFTRTSATKDPKVRDEPEGLIDPWLKTLSFWNDAQPLAALHYYATHPMSYYGDGRCRRDFCGLARQKRQDEDAKVFQVYFTGCAGNVTAGKYNDGAKENRPVLRDRIHDAMTAAWKATKRQPVEGWEWRVEPVKLPPRDGSQLRRGASKKVLEDEKQTKARRNNAAFQLAWLKRVERPIDLTCLDFGPVPRAAPAGRAVHRVPAQAQELRQGRASSAWPATATAVPATSRRAGLPRGRLRADRGAGGPAVRGDPSPGDGEAAAGLGSFIDHQVVNSPHCVCRFVGVADRGIRTCVEGPPANARQCARGGTDAWQAHPILRRGIRTCVERPPPMRGGGYRCARSASHFAPRDQDLRRTTASGCSIRFCCRDARAPLSGRGQTDANLD